MKKRLLSVILVMLYALVMVLPASATTITDDDNAELISAPVYRPADFDYEEAAATDNAKMAQAQLMLASQPELAAESSTEWINLSSTYTMVGQIYRNYCVPASVRAILGYNNGGLSNAPSQTTIATALGTGTAGSTVGTPFDLDMLNYVNSQNQSGYDYAWHDKYLSTLTDVQDRVHIAINLYDMPPMLWVITEESSEWGIAYNHAVTAYRVRGDKSEIGIADPWPMFSGEGDTFYDISANGVYQDLEAMIW